MFLTAFTLAIRLDIKHMTEAPENLIVLFMTETCSTASLHCPALIKGLYPASKTLLMQPQLGMQAGARLQLAAHNSLKSGVPCESCGSRTGLSQI